MSIGVGACAHKVLEDENTVIYEYGGFNLNQPEFRNENQICDGTITIDKSCFAEPEIHEKLKKMPSGRKKMIVKRIHVSVDYGEMLKDGRIKVENCSNCWETRENDLQVDIVVFSLLHHLFNEYQDESKIPEEISFYK